MRLGRCDRHHDKLEMRHFASSGREPHITTPLRENAAVQCGTVALPPKPTSLGAAGTAEKCQEATYAVRQVLLPFPGRRTGNTKPLPGSL